MKFRCNKKYADYLQKHKDNIRQATLSKLPCGEYWLSILVDGDLLTRLMIEYNLGVFTHKTYEVKRIDLDFFSDDL
mgnify:CR=1 FL=1